jgi:RHS repeat-associated protein
MYDYDGAGRLAGLTSSWSDSEHPSPLFCAGSISGVNCPNQSAEAYNASGQLQNAQLALNSTNQPALTLTRNYDLRLRPTSETVAGQTGTPGVAASAMVTVSGSEQSIGGSGTAAQATGNISLSYSGAQTMVVRPLYASNSITLPDGYHASFVATGNSAVTVANAIASVLNANSSPVAAVVAAGGTAAAASVTLTTKATGADQNGAITLSLATTKVVAAPASLSGGAGSTYDTGTVTANINGTAVSAGYGAASTPQTVAAALASAMSSSAAGVTATASGSGTITVSANETGTSGNGISVTLSSATNETKFFSSASFSGTSGTLSGGEAGTLSPGPIYAYSLTFPGGATGYAANGNVAAYTDQYTPTSGAWTLMYDHLNRVTLAGVTGGQWNSLTLGWMYDSFGNRETQTVGGPPASQVPQSQTLSFSGSADNRIDNYGPGGYDMAGDVHFDGVNTYLYDNEGRLCAVAYVSGTGTAYMQYIYDAEGRRVGEASIDSLSCDPATQPNNNGFAQTASYLLGLSGEQISELDGSGGFKRSQVYANGQLLATYNTSTVEFPFSDWLGTKRVVANPLGAVIGTCASLPFGDALGCTGGLSLSGHHFTGQLHDAESGNDYFGARYYGDYTGRFMSPDFNAADDDLDPVPYADLSNPQSLNLYSYVQNNPLSHKDADGHKCDGGSVGPDGTFTFHCTNDPPPNPNGTAYQLAGALGAGFAPETGGASLAIAAGAVGAMLAAEYLAAHPIHLSSSNEPAPTPPGATPTVPVPSGLVGTQDGKSGQAGGRHNSGPLDPAHGGSGDAARDFNTLTGGKTGPASAGSNYPPGTQVGDNGISLRPARGNSGPRIDIPDNGGKPHETLHYPN